MSAHLPSQVMTLTTSDGLKLEADVYPTHRPWCILAHGKAYDKSAWNHLAADMQQWGWTVLAPNFRGYGHSEQGNGSRYDQDILASIAFARSKHAEPLVLLGASMGGIAILAALAGNDVIVDGVVLLSPAGGIEYLPHLSGKASRGLLLFSENEAYVAPAREIAAHPPFPIYVRMWSGDLHAHKLLDNPQSGSEVRAVIRNFLAHHL
ncbi:MAG: alpha/beta hydrolase [Acidithiobacillus ferrooxidans]|uniref:Serine aminopeptidase S33 domain-containing protein n=1 Tax=mine drainage metagenome TaxID=410659 RepID=E6QGE7_9ZZZZ